LDNAGVVDTKELNEKYGQLIIEGESIDIGFKVIRDTFVCSVMVITLHIEPVEDVAMSPPTGLEEVLLKHFNPKEVNDMTTEKKVARRTLSLLELAAEMKNVSRACKIMGYSPQQFYEIRRNYQTYGAEGLIDRLPGPKGPPPQPRIRGNRKGYSGSLFGLSHPRVPSSCR
jgi:hypothetical protein